jgi:hypothetical protein
VKRIAFLLVAVVLVGSIGLAAALALGDPSATNEPNPSRRTPTGSETAAPTLEAVTESWEAISYGPPDTPSPLRATPQNHLWFHDDSWWGVFLSADTADHRIYRLDPEEGRWTATGVVVDERTFAHMDVLWDGASLVVASAGPQATARHALRITRFTYVAEAGSYLRDADFPAQLTDSGVEAVTVVRAADARLWVAYRAGTHIEMNHSLESDLAWRGPFVPEQADGVAAEAALAAIGDHVALVWTTPTDDAVYAAIHDVTGPADLWISLSPAPMPGLSLGENHVSVAADPSPGAERLFVAVRLGLDTVESPDRLDPQIMLAEMRVDEEPRVHLFGRVRDQYGPPHVVVDGESRVLYLLAPVPRAGGSIYVKWASLDNLAFSTGIGTTFLEATGDHPQLRALTATKQALDTSSGLMVAATDQSAGVYAFGSLGVAKGTGSGAPPSSGPTITAPLLDQTFDGVPVNSDVAGWEVSEDSGAPFQIAVLSGADGSARLTATEVDARACARIELQTEGVLRIEAESLFNVATPADVFLLQVRGDGGEVASVRMREGLLVYPDGEERVETDRVLLPGRWYRSEIELDFGSQTYTLRVRDVASGTSLISEDGLDWRTAEVPSVNRICIEVPAVEGLDLYLDNVRASTEGAGER